MKKLFSPIILVVVMVLVTEIVNPLILPYIGIGLITAVLLKS